MTDQSAAGLGHISLRLRRHAQWLVSEHRSPLYAALMTGAADDLDAGGIVAQLFAHVDAGPGSVPQLRLMAALHELVLTGLAPELAPFFASVGGDRPPAHAWPAAQRALHERAAWIEPRLHRTVQTNEVGRCTVLMAVLLWLTEGHHRPVRLLEVGASAGLNLLVDRYRYAQDGVVIGDPLCPVGFDDPWAPPPPIDLAAAAVQLRISHRAGCDLHPLDPTDPEDQRRLLSYIWPDETDRLTRLRAALQIAAAEPSPVTAASALHWLQGALDQRLPGELTVVWHSVVRQYVPPAQWRAIQDILRRVAAADPSRPLVWVGMEPTPERVLGCEVWAALPTPSGLSEPQRLAACGDHGPPVVWNHSGASSGTSSSSASK